MYWVLNTKHFNREFLVGIICNKIKSFLTYDLNSQALTLLKNQSVWFFDNFSLTNEVLLYYCNLQSSKLEPD